MQYKRRVIFLAGFLFSIPLALTSYINSSYLKEYLSDGGIGLFYTVASILAIICLARMPNMLNKYGNKKSILIFSALTLFSLLLITFGKNIYIVLPAFALFFIGSDLILASLDIFVEDFSKNSSIGRLRGVYLTCVNLAWVVAQMISGSIIAKSSFVGIYLFSALFIVLMMLSFVLLLKNFKDPKYRQVPILKTVKTFICSKKLSKIYLINFILRFFFAWMVIYTPIYLVETIGFNWSQVGIIFSIMLLPFVLLTYPLGKLSDRVGEKKLLKVGFIIMAIFTLLLPYLSTPSIIIFASILFMTRVGAAIIEAMSEIYFFRIVDSEDADEIAFFKNIYPLSFVIAPAVGSLVLFLMKDNLSLLFPILSALLLVGFMITLKLKDVR